MATMNVSLPAELADFVERAVAAGDYGSASEVVRESLRRLRDQKAVEGEQHAILRREVQRGLDDARAGRLTDRGIADIARSARSSNGDA